MSLRATVLIPIACLAMTACAGYRKIVERGKCSEGVRWLDALRRAEESHLVKTGSLEPSLDAMKDALPLLTLFTPGPLMIARDPRKHEVSWSVTLVRGGPGKRGCSPEYGCYTLAFAWSSLHPPTFSCSTTSCERDLLLKNRLGT